MSLASLSDAAARERRPAATRRRAEGNTPAQVLRLAALVLLTALCVGVAIASKAGRETLQTGPATLHSAAMR